MMTGPDCVFSMVVSDATEGFIVIGSMAPGEKGLHSHAFPVAEVEAAQAYALTLARTHQVYVESALQRVRPKQGRRGTEAGASQFSLVSLDFDGAWGKHTESRLPQSPDDLPLLLKAAEAPPPSLVLNTGGGLLALWKLDAALALPDSDKAIRSRAKQISVGFQRRIREVAERRFGWKLDGTADLCRFIRVPGTLNHKFSPPRTVEVLA